jgi:hypothetical protein
MAKDTYAFTPVNPTGVGQGFNQQQSIQNQAFDNIDKGFEALLKIPRDIRETEKKEFQTLGKRNVDDVINNINAIGDIDTFLAQEDSLVPTKESLTEQGFGTVMPFGEHSIEGGIARVQAATEAKRKALLDKETSMFTRQDTLNKRDINEASSILEDYLVSNNLRGDYDEAVEYVESGKFLEDNPQYKNTAGLQQGLKKYLMGTDPAEGFVSSKKRKDFADEMDLIDVTNAELVNRIATSPLIVDVPEILDADGNVDDEFYTREYKDQGETREVIAEMIRTNNLQVENSLLNDLEPGDKGYDAALYTVSSKMATGLLQLSRTPGALDYNPEAYVAQQQKEIQALQTQPGARITEQSHPGLYAHLRLQENLEPTKPRGQGGKKGKYFTINKDTKTGVDNYLATLATKEGILNQDAKFVLTPANIKTLLSFPDTLVNEDILSELGEADYKNLNKRIVKHKQDIAASVDINAVRASSARALRVLQQKASDTIAANNKRKEQLNRKLLVDRQTK